MAREIVLTPDPERDKRLALKLATRTADAFRDAERERAAGMLFAQMAGASLREIETATGVPFKTVQRIIERHPGDDDT